MSLRFNYRGECIISFEYSASRLSNTTAVVRLVESDIRLDIVYCCKKMTHHIKSKALPSEPSQLDIVESKSFTIHQELS